MSPELLKKIIADQQEEKALPKDFTPRLQEEKLQKFGDNNEIIVLTGVRRCGKSVLIQRVRNKNKEKDYYFNFEDERLASFDSSHFQILQEVFVELFGVQKNFYFDEIQNIEKWELFVRRLYNSGNKIYITGSNASLFSEELGTRLTGRFLAVRIYPFSFAEFVQFQSPTLMHKKNYSTQDIGLMLQAFQLYCKKGGFPEYVKHGQTEYLHSLYESIIYKDIIVRYKITNTKALKELVHYLASNCSKEMTYNSIKKWIGLGSATTISEYCGFLENSFLCFFVNRYHDSVKTQMLSPKKVYFIDHEFARIIGFRSSEDRGRLLENIVFLELKRREFEIYYYKENKECDFILRKNGVIENAVQVCQNFEAPDTKKREFDGLLEAMERFSLNSGLILTEREEETKEILHKNKSYKIILKPIWKWLLQG